MLTDVVTHVTASPDTVDPLGTGGNEQQKNSVQSPPDRSKLSKYTPKDAIDPQELKRQIRFKEQVVRTLRESCDREIKALETEIGDMQKTLIAKTKPSAALEPETLDKIVSPTRSDSAPTPKMRGLSLYDDCQDCLQISRDAEAARLRRRMPRDEGGENGISPPMEREWWRDRNTVEKQSINYSRYAAYFGVFGAACALAQNELILQETEPHAPFMEALKMANTCATIFCLLCIYRIYWLATLVFRINRHCRRMTPLNADISIGDVFSQLTFWIEVCVVIVHCPPFYTYEYWTISFENIVVYR